MTQKMVVKLNGSSVVEYDRSKALEPRQQEYLDRMDRTMDRGITIHQREIDDPGPEARLEFVAGQLYQALQADNEAMIAAMCSYIATRREDAREVVLDDANGQVSIEIRVDDGDPYRVDGIPVTLQ
jgi:hypothetical protein